MGYAIMRTGKLSSFKAMSDSHKHNFRLIKTENANPELFSLNEELIPEAVGKSYRELFENRISSLEYYKTHKVRANAVLAHEIMLTYSPTEKDKIDLDKWKADNIEWLRKVFNSNPLTYGDNLVSAVLHLDEGTPHIHAIIVPIDDKGHLNAYHYIHGPKHLRELQTDYAKFMKEKHGLERGQQFSVSSHETMKEYYASINKAIATSAPEIIPGETVEEYKKRADKAMGSLALALEARIRGKQADFEKIASTERRKRKEVEMGLIQAQKTIRQISSRDDEFEREFGSFQSAASRLKAMDALVAAFANHPDESEREYVRQKMNEYIRYGRQVLEEQKKQERKKKKKEKEKGHNL